MAPADRGRELETLLARIRNAGSFALYYDMWDQHGAEHASDEERAAMEADFAAAQRERREATLALEALVAKTHAEAPAELAAWANAHDAYLAEFIADCGARGESAGTAAFVAANERTEWAEVRAGTRAYVAENNYYVTMNVERYRRLFGIDPRTCERVDASPPPSADRRGRAGR